MKQKEVQPLDFSRPTLSTKKSTSWNEINQNFQKKENFIKSRKMVAVLDSPLNVLAKPSDFMANNSKKVGGQVKVRAAVKSKQLNITFLNNHDKT